MERLLQYPSVKEALLYERLSGERVRCGVCERRCVIPLGKKGFCSTRTNIDGKLYTIVFGDLCALESRPIEIKPFFHFWPGSTALTFSTWSCNFNCPWCQNHHISKTRPDPREAKFVSPERLVDNAVSRGDKGMCGSFGEPTLLFDYSLVVFNIAKKRGLYNCFVSNGYLTTKALSVLREKGMDAIKIDLKGDNTVYKEYCDGVNVDIVWRNARMAKKMGLHIEIVNLVITGVNDTPQSIEWVVERHLKEVGGDTPLHFTRYYPAYKFSNPETKIETLEMAYKIAKKSGIHYPYIGNVPGHKYENTYCPNCSELLIKRLGFSITEVRVKMDKKCPKCGLPIPITGHLPI